MDVIIHHKPNVNEKHVSLFIYSVRTKKHPKWWVYHICEYYVERSIFHEKKTYVLLVEIEALYEATHEIPNCDDCELVEAPVNYRQMEMEDRD